LIKLEDLVLTHINNPHKRRAGRSTSRTTIDWTSISQVQNCSTLCDCGACCADLALLFSAADGAALHGLQGQVEEDPRLQHEEG
jgi:hypothetical protein